jgi:hypothetical protein
MGLLGLPQPIIVIAFRTYAHKVVGAPFSCSTAETLTLFDCNNNSR